MIAIVRFKALPGRRFKIVEAVTDFDHPDGPGQCYSVKMHCAFYRAPFDCPKGAGDVCMGPIKTIFEEVK